MVFSLSRYLICSISCRKDSIAILIIQTKQRFFRIVLKKSGEINFFLMLERLEKSGF